MILLNNGIIKLEYEPASDILTVDYPSLEKYTLFMVENCLRLMVEAVRNYDVKKLLLDASRTLVDVSDEENRRISMSLATELAQTRLSKVARINTSTANGEIKAQENIRKMEQAGLLPYQLKSFSSKAKALEWLRNDS